MWWMAHWLLNPAGMPNLVMGVRTQSYVGIMNQAPHPNAAKLWIRFILTPDGAKPWMSIGNYLPRTDIAAR